nr:MAG TPA: hypothetical protein [Bacteriophage sp.]
MKLICINGILITATVKLKISLRLNSGINNL